MKTKFIILILSLYTLTLTGQHLGAYSDYRGRFYIFDHGQSTLVEDLEVLDYKIGGNCVLYLNNQNRLKVYTNGKVNELEIGGVSNLFATDYIAAYSINQKLKVIENGEAVTLSHRCPIYQVEDSLIVFFDENKASLRVYYNGITEDIENGLLGLPVEHLKSGDNIIAYISSDTKDFKVYYRGELHTLLSHVRHITYDAGKDIVAYINELDNTFNVFYKGESILLEDFPPESYKTGDGFVAYVDQMGNFKVFYKGKKIELSGYAPESYVCEDNLVLIADNEYYSIFYMGEVYEVESFIPLYSDVDWNTIVFLDNTRRVWMYSKGKKEYLVNDSVEAIRVYRDLVVLSLAMDRTKIYYQGKVYDGESY
ncbi:MAG: hypothetical protein JW801_04370 [Bacteroidales bacterium]|nr:hypothetical protein [Bacteroidales bacterium]